MSDITTNVERVVIQQTDELVNVKVISDNIKLIEVGNVIVRDNAPTNYIDSEYIAGEAISAHRIVKLVNNKVYYASNDELNSFNTVIGMSLNAAITNDVVKVRRLGIIEQTSWGLQESSFYYLGLNGLITKDVNSNGEFIQCIGYAQTNEKLNLDIKQPIGL